MGIQGYATSAVAWTVSYGVEWSPKISLPLPLQGLHSYLFPISPVASSFSFSDMVQNLSRLDLDVKYDMHCTSLIFHSASVSVNPTSWRSRNYDDTDPDDYSNTMIWASLPVYLPYIRIRKLGIHPPQLPALSHCSSWHNRHCFFLLTSWRVALERTPGYHWLCIHVVWHALHSNLLIS
jgi:hypothetical protein